MSGSVVAQFHGECSECEAPVVPGERITSIDGEWIHADCEARPEKAVCVCEKCWLVHAGSECL